MPLTITPSDTTDTTEEAVLALVKHLHDEAEGELAAKGVPLNDGTGDMPDAAVTRGRREAFAQVAQAIASGEHWNMPGQSV